MNSALLYNNNLVQISGCHTIHLKILSVGSWGEGTPSSVIGGTALGQIL